MSLIALKNPEALLAYVPFCGAEKLQLCWEPQDFGITSTPSDPKLSFGFVRHPIDRFVQVYQHYSEGNPEVSIEHFIDKALFEKDYEFEWSITTNTLPLTNTIYGLDKVQFIGRYERLINDCKAIMAYLGLTLPKGYVIVPNTYNNWKEIFSNLDKDYKEKLIEYYRTDFETYRYEIPNSLSGT